jgi:Domain of unknown function (DUF4263)
MDGDRGGIDDNASVNRAATRTFQLENSPVPAWSWEQYADWLAASWPAALHDATAAASDERVTHEYLEKHPCLLPGVSSETPVLRGHHGPLFDSVFSQPPMPGIERRVPDFMWITSNSAALVPVLIELERPSRRWFRGDGVQSEAVTIAVDQLLEWKAWFANPNQLNLFYDLYRIPTRLRGLRFAPRFILIHGRRRELEDEALLSGKRLNIGGTDMELMTYDRLAPAYALHDCLTVRVAKREFIAVSIPPTFVLGPATRSVLKNVRDLDVAVGANTLLQAERTRFLQRRLPYWQEWARRPEPPLFGPDDAE